MARMTRKQKTIGVAIAVAVLAAAGISYAVTSSGGASSGKQVVVLSTVQRRTLQGTVNLTGTLARKETTKVNAATQGLVSDVSVKDGTVTKTGNEMFSINGRNAIAENGTLPFFRALVPGDSGADVVQLKQILNAAGDYAGPSTNNLYTEQTQFALAQWQAQQNYPNSSPATPESVSVSLQQGPGYQLGDQDTAGLIIGPPATQAASVTRTSRPAQPMAVLADDPVPVLTIASVADQVTAGQAATFVVSASTTSTSAVTVNLTPGGTAGSQNVISPPTSVTLAAGALQASVTVQTRATTTVQPNTTITMSLASGTGYSVGSPASAQTTIANTAVPTLQISGGTNVSPGGAVTLTVTANQAPLQDTQVALSFGGNASPGTDYMVPDPVLTLAAGATSATFTLTTEQTSTIKPNDYIVVSISPNPSQYSVGTSGSAVVTINGTLTQPTVTLTSATTYLQKGQPYAVSVGLSQALSQPVTINLSYGGTAQQGVDYSLPAGLLTIPAGQTSLTVQIPTVTDNLVEPNRVLTVALAPSSSYQVGSPSSASVTITSQVVPKLTIAAATSSVAQGGAAAFVITATQAPAQDTSVNFAVEGTAQPGQSYQPLTGTALLKAGQTSVTVTIQSLQRNITFEPTDMIVGSWPTRVGTVYVKAGQPVTTGTPILSLTEPELTVTLDASASNRTQLAVGQACTVQINGESSSVSGSITELDSTPTQVAAAAGQPASQVYEGTIEAPELDGADGSAVSITVVTEQKSDALTVPIAAVKQNGTGQDVVRVVELAHGGRIVEVPVTTGLTEGSYIEIKRGLSVGQTVVVEVDSSS
ncbi:MAG: Calx-beta domain-containing protein [Acidimicrobiales bacterium]